MNNQRFVMSGVDKDPHPERSRVQKRTARPITSPSDDEDHTEAERKQGNAPAEVPEWALMMMSKFDQVQEFITELRDDLAIVSAKVEDLEEGELKNSTKRVKELAPRTSTETPKNSKRRHSILESVLASGKKISWKAALSSDEDESESKKLTAKNLNFGTGDEDDEKEDLGKDNPKSYGSESPKGKLFADLRNSSAAASQKVMVMRKEKECTVRITNFQLSTVSKAIKEIMDFQEEENTKVNMTKVITRPLKQHLKARYEITTDALAKMSLDNLVQIIALETKVYSPTTFYKELKAALSHIKIMEWKYVNPMNHQAFYFQQLRLMDEFERLLKIMLVENKEHCPYVDDKEGGLIRLFKDLNDKTYVKYACAGLSKRKYESMKEFFEEYSQIILSHYQLSQAVKDIPYHSHTEHEEKQQEYFKKRREISSRLSNSKFNGPAKTSRDNHGDILGNLSNMEQEFDEAEDTWKDVNADMDNINQGYESEDSVSVNSKEDFKMSSSSSKPVKVPENEQDAHDLQAFGEQQGTPDKKSLACLKKLLGGKCDNLNCPYGHSNEILKKHALGMKDKLNAFLQSNGAPPKDNPAYTILKNDKSKF